MDIEFQYYMTYRRENVGTSDESNEYLWKEGFKNSNWFQFEEAVKFNQRLAESILNPLIVKTRISCKSLVKIE